MGLFDVFKKKECCICGDEVGIIGNRKLSDGNMCSKCAKNLSPWFEDRKESSVEQIRAQLGYREQNARELESFNVCRTVGDFYKMYIEEVNDVPSRFFVTDASDYMEANPDIISFKDIISCVTDIEIRDEEMKQRNDEGEMCSYDPPRFKHHHNFHIKMQIRNNPYFDHIRFCINSGVVTLESVGGIGGGGGLFGGSLSTVFSGSMANRVSGNSFTNSREQKRYNEYRQMCSIIEQTVEDGKRGAQAVSRGGGDDAIELMLQDLRNAPDEETLAKLQMSLVVMTMNHPQEEKYREQMVNATTEARMRMDYLAAGLTPPTQTSEPAQKGEAPKFCPGCGEATEGGKFCPNCGTKLF